MNKKKRILVFASGSANQDSSGSGFKELVLDTQSGGVLTADIIGVVSHHLGGSIEMRARELGIPFHHMMAATCYEYSQVLTKFQPDLIVLCGWLKKVIGIIGEVPIVNIHPAPLPRFGGKGMYGLKVHEAVLKSELAQTMITIHWVDSEYDTGKVITTYPVPILPGDTPQKLQKRVQAFEHCIYGDIVHKHVLPKLPQ